MSNFISDRVKKILPSFTLQMATKAAEMRSQGIDIINFSVGEPDFNTPSHIINAAKKAMDDGFTKYTAGPGMIEFREAICEKLKRENGLNCDPSEILVSNGEKHSLHNACQALINPGDEVVVFSPYWVSFPEFVKLSDGVPVIVKTKPGNNYEPDFNDLEQKSSPKIKCVIINSPSNPTGGVWRPEAICRILKIAKKFNWVVISDECYERLVYEGEFFSAEKLNRAEKIGATVVSCFSLSKTYAMTGWRIGYSSGPKEIINAMAKIQGQATSCANSISQKAGIIALTGDQECVNKMKNKFLDRRNHMLSLLNNLNNITIDIPKGAFYAFPNLNKYIGKRVNRKIIKDTFDISDYILEVAKVVTVPGDGFGAPGYIRLSYATNKKNISEGINRIKMALGNIK